MNHADIINKLDKVSGAGNASFLIACGWYLEKGDYFTSAILFGVGFFMGFMRDVIKAIKEKSGVDLTDILKKDGLKDTLNKGTRMVFKG